MHVSVAKPNHNHNAKYISVVGQMFHNMRVIVDWSENGTHMCLCQCQCGHIDIYNAECLKRRKTTPCVCGKQKENPLSQCINFVTEDAVCHRLKETHNAQFLKRWQRLNVRHKHNTRIRVCANKDEL